MQVNRLFTIYDKAQYIKQLEISAFKNIFALALSFSFLLFTTSVSANDALKMSLDVRKVVTNIDGSRTYIPVSTAPSGATIQYRASYSNISNNAINDLVITLPIPTNMTFTGEVYPASAQATTDYHNYADMPLMRHIDGRLVRVPYTEYKALRWNIRYLPAQKSASVALNAVLN